MGKGVGWGETSLMYISMYIHAIRQQKIIGVGEAREVGEEEYGGWSSKREGGEREKMCRRKKGKVCAGE